MTEGLITGALAIAAILAKRKDLKNLLPKSKNAKIIEIITEQLNKSEARNLELEKKNNDLTERILKSRGKKA